MGGYMQIEKRKSIEELNLIDDFLFGFCPMIPLEKTE